MCRSFLTPDRFTDAGIGNIAKAGNYVEGKHRYYGRFNGGVATLNLPYIACESNGDMDEFWKLLEKYCEAGHQVLKIKHDHLIGIKSDTSPLLFQHGAIARLDAGEEITPLLYDGYSTMSLGYAGINEMTYRMLGVPHTEPKGTEFALKVMQYLNDQCALWKADENIDYSVYGSPIENTTYTFAKAVQNKFGIIEHVSDRNFVTNSSHIHVEQPINAFDKLTFEAQFAELSPGGVVNYVECNRMEYNLEAVLALFRHIYDNILYAELNIKSDRCNSCGSELPCEIKEDEHGKLYWTCTVCGENREEFLNVARRTCGSNNRFTLNR